ncbi:MAG: CRISPR-associated helicase Cas3' [Halanaerobiales bacterium]|nr:CRISPR-associated helicase Cas3' [Halanaerobiales bacterium]
MLAKTYPKVENIEEHTQRLLSNLSILLSLYKDSIKYLDEDILEMVCIYHDLGKINTKFQNKLLKVIGEEQLQDKNPEIDEFPHGILSIAFLPKKMLYKKFDKNDIEIIYQSVAFHHARAFHYIREDEFKLVDYKKIINYDLKNNINLLNFELINNLETSIPSRKYYSPKRRINSLDNNKDTFYMYVTIKGLLNRLDYAASAHIPVEIENKKLEENTKDFIKIELDSSLNDLQSHMQNHQDENNIIIASTGSGKTEAGLLWIGNNKGFFTLPLKVSINAIYDRIKDKINFQNVGLLHSDTYAEYIKRGLIEDGNYYDLTKKMSLPVIISTLDQLIDFIFKYDGFEYKLATLSYSKIIIDEIQMYSSDLIAYIILALKYISEIGGKFSIVTATFPPFIKDILNAYNIPCNDPKYFLGEKIRHRMRIFAENININRIVDKVDDKKVLIICNTVKKSQEIYRGLKKELDESIEINLLHSRFIRKDRDIKEENIFDMGQPQSDKKGIWITTQIVEASMDIDFDILFTELQELSSLFQRMGRVYRKRELNTDFNNIYVFTGDNNPTSGISNNPFSITDLEIFKLSKAELQKYDESIVSERNKIEMIDNVYTTAKISKTDYYKNIIDTIDYIKDIPEYRFGKNENKLRNIFNEKIIPETVYQENSNIIEEKLEIIESRKDRKEIEKAKDKLEKYIVPVPIYYAKKYSRRITIDKYTQIKIIDFKYNSNVGVIFENNSKISKIKGNNII